MSDVKISELPPASAATATDRVAAVQSGVTKGVTLQQVVDWLQTLTWPTAPFYNITSQAGGAETLATWKVTDISTAAFEIRNATSTDGIFEPLLRGTGSLNNPALQLRAAGTFDTGTSPLGIFDARIGASTAVATRPLFQWQNNGVTVATVSAAGTWTFSVPAAASAPETLATWTVGDDAISSLAVLNASATNGLFTPTLYFTSSGTNIGGYTAYQAATDTGSNALGVLVARIGSASLVATRPIYEWRNHTTPILQLLPLNAGANAALSWGTQTTGAPTFTTRSNGTRVVLVGQLDATHVDYALGAENSYTWISSPNSSATTGVKIYAGTTLTHTLRGDGHLDLPLGGLRVAGATVVATGPALEVLHNGTAGSINSYDRSAASWKTLAIQALSVSLSPSGTASFTAAATSNDSAVMLRATGSSTPGSGSGLELFYGGAAGNVQAYDRTGSSYLPLIMKGSTVTLSPSGTAEAVIASTGLSLAHALNVGSTTTNVGAILDFGVVAGNTARLLAFNGSRQALVLDGLTTSLYGNGTSMLVVDGTHVAISAPTTLTGTLTINKTAGASSQEVLQDNTVSDDSGSHLYVDNDSASDNFFRPRLRGVQSTTLTALTLQAEATTDTGTSAVMRQVVRTTAGVAIATRPLWELVNFGNTMLQLLPLSAGANAALTWGTTPGAGAAPALNSMGAGTSLVLYNKADASNANLAIGTRSTGGAMWLSVPNSSGVVEIYGGATKSHVFRGDGLTDVIGVVRATGNGAPSTGAGAALDYGSIANTGRLFVYDYTGSAYKNVQVEGLAVKLAPNGVAAASYATGGAATYTVQAVASTAETLATWQISDDATSKLEIVNGSGADGFFNPLIRGTSQTTGPGLQFKSVIGTDSGALGAYYLNASTAASAAITTRPLFDLLNANTTVLQVLPLNAGANAALSWGTQANNPPAFTTRSSGTRSIYYNALGAADVDYAHGVDSGTLWASVPRATSAYFHKFYAGTTLVSSIRGDGLFDNTGTIRATGNTPAATGVGAELAWNGTRVQLLAYNRTGSSYQPLSLDGSVVDLRPNGAAVLTAAGSGLTMTQVVGTSGSPTFATWTGAAHTTLAAGTEAVDINYNLARTVQFATGALATQRAVVFQAPTYGFVAASTLTTAATVAIAGAPAVGTNATITNRHALWVQSGNAQFDGTIRSASTPTVSSDLTNKAYVDTLKLYPVIGGCSGKPAASQYLAMVKFDQAVTLKANMPNSQGYSRGAATATAVATLYKNGVAITNGTLTWSAAGTVPTFGANADVNFASGDIFEVVAPTSQDSTLANVSFTIQFVIQ